MKEGEPLTFKEYQEKQEQTAFYPNRGEDIKYPALELFGEIAELVEVVLQIEEKSGFLSEEDILNLREEIGDSLWSLSDLAGIFGLDLDEIARQNLKKAFVKKEKRNQHQEVDSK